MIRGINGAQLSVIIKFVIKRCRPDDRANLEIRFVAAGCSDAMDFPNVTGWSDTQTYLYFASREYSS